MRIARAVVLFSCVFLVAGFAVEGQSTKYGVSVKTSKPAALAKAKTYVWMASQPSYDKNVDALIVGAVDRELGARGLTKLPSGQSDLVVTYASLSRTDVDVKKAAKGAAPPELSVGTLVVDLRDATNQQVLFRVRMDTPIEKGPALDATINAAVTAMFEKYPPPPKR